MFCINRQLITKKILYKTNYSNQVKRAKSILQILNSASVDEQITIKGWIKSLRKLKELTFFDVSDGSSERKLQVLIPQSLKSPSLSVGASISAVGCLKTSPKGQLEFHAEKLNVIGECDLKDAYPFLPRKTYLPEYVRQYLHLRPQTNKFASLLRVRSQATAAINNFFISEGYINIHTPILTSNDCEGAGEVFTVQPENKKILKDMCKAGKLPDEAYFDTKAYLTVSGQLHLEAAAHGLTKVYTFGPTFRAENSRSRLHLSEFYMIEAELAFVNSLEDVIEVVEKLVKNVTENILNLCQEDVEKLQEINNINTSWINSKFPIITYDEAVQIMNNNVGKYKGLFDQNEGFSKEHEIFLVKHCGDVPIFIINWPKNMKPFYMRECHNDNSKVAALDLLAPNVGEVVGGSLRENDYNKLKEQLPENSNFDWYLELRKYGGVPTGGFGLGFERYLQMILGINSIKDTIPFPRWPHNCSL